ncbi:efflux RND transporter periplasmic adaptor subunit [Filimonas effusa]|uniref:Efflux RND transporter periplasmic adaptor subunit n=1 Tax=Filimonas effusa TaxID=2508721 RepID=A0A4Q1D2A5_9BACT|nr:efflux RND transporter periplasmic adaptor subunit [Filimonas effusa]RXK81971.1 efflux RND transporter periplasmic adaptor subunit [Filimonas effusa]
MQKLVHITLFACMLAAISCGKKTTLDEKKAELEKLKKEQISVNDKVSKLEAEIIKIDPAALPEKPKLVALEVVKPEAFTHYIDLQGTVTSDDIAWVTPQNQGGQVKAIYVKQGDYVKKGQLLLKLDNEAARTQLGPLEVQLENAKDMLRRRQNLWDQGIGAEVELISAKTAVSNLQKQIDAVNVSVGQYNVYAPSNGVAETVSIRVGETFNAAGATVKGIQIVNTGTLKVSANVPENYIGRVKEGSTVLVSFPDLNKKLNVKVSVVGKTIGATTRSFYIEAKLPGDQQLKPNQVALVQLQDYAVNNAITAPVNTMQSDDKGKFIMLAIQEPNKQWRARKRTVVPGELYGDKIEIKSGLQPGDQVVTDGYQSLYEGQLLTTH